MSINRNNKIHSNLEELSTDLCSSTQNVCPKSQEALDTKEKGIKLLARSQTLNTIFDHTPTILVLLDVNLRLLRLNKQALKITGRREEDLVGKCPCEILNCLSINQLGEKTCCKETRRNTCEIFLKITKTMETGIPYLEETVEIQATNFGERFTYTFMFSCHLIEEADDKIVMLSLTNITEAKEKEIHLKRQKRSITLNNRIANTFLTSPKKEVFDRILEAVIRPLDSAEGYFGYFNDEELICPAVYTEQEVNTNDNQDNSLVKYLDKNPLLQKSLLNKRTVVINELANAPIGFTGLNSILAVPIVNDRVVIGQFVLANKKDGYTEHDQALLESAAAQTAPILHSYLQEAKRLKSHQILEEQFRQSQKLESIGRLAGGIAHDLNNLLSPVMGYGELLVNQLEGTKHFDIANEIVGASHRASELIGQLLSFSRKQPLETRNICLNEILDKFKTLLQRSLNSNISITYSKSENLPHIEADTIQIERIILNLSVNAQDAMPHGGQLSLSTSVEEKLIDNEHVDLVVLRVTDNGCGMTEEVVNQAFEPFFTTKGEDQGTGLGLSSVYGIIKQHNGHIELNSTLGNGSEFVLYFPISNAIDVKTTDNEELTVMAKKEQLADASQHILLVEDNKQVRDLARTILERQGFMVTWAVDGEEVLERDLDELAPIDLLLTDVIMPGVNGRELFEQLSQRHNDLKVVYMSGFTDEVVSHQGLAKQGISFIQKPFAVSDFIAIIKNAIA